MSKRIVCWIGDAPNHRALVNKIALQYEVVGIIVDVKKKIRKNTGLVSSWRKLINKLYFGKIDRAWAGMQQYYRQKFPGWPGKPMLTIDSINDSAAYELTKKLEPDMVVVSGTSLIKDPLVSMSLPIGIINLHTGLSPYVKGGPNCTNWCIANNQWGLIGNTILWLSSGIDSGHIICSERIDVSNLKELNQIHFNVMEHAHDLYLRAIKYIFSMNPPYQSIPQKSLGKGNLYLTKMWTSKQKENLLRNLSGNRNNVLLAEVKTIPLPF